MVLGPKFAPSHCDMVDKDHDRHPLAERVCHQGRGVALPLAGMTGHQRLVRAGGRRLPRETLSCSHQRLARARATLAIARQGGLPVSVRGSVGPLRPDVHRVGFAGVRAGKRGVCKRGETCPCRGWQGEHAWRWRGGTVGAGLCSGTRPTVFRSLRCQKMSAGRQDNTSSADDHSQL